MVQLTVGSFVGVIGIVVVVVVSLEFRFCGYAMFVRKCLWFIVWLENADLGGKLNLTQVLNTRQEVQRGKLHSGDTDQRL